MKMKKFLNNPEHLREEMLEGLALSNPDILYLGDGGLVINKHLDSADRVTVVSLGGIGHEPAMVGFVGEGMLDISVPGDIFAAPAPQLCLEALKKADRGNGVLFIALNHTGDVLSSNMAMRLAQEAGLHVKQLITCEDVSNASNCSPEGRRGLSGCIPVFKIAGAACQKGYDLDQVYEIASGFAENMATISVASRGATHPITGREISLIGENNMEIGIGQHGEGGGVCYPMKTADETVAIMVQSLIDNLKLQAGEKVLLMINGSGATSTMELLICYRSAYNYLASKGIQIVAGLADELLTVQETSGFQVCVARMNDELLDLWNMPCKSAYFSK